MMQIARQMGDHGDLKIESSADTFKTTDMSDARRQQATTVGDGSNETDANVREALFSFCQQAKDNEAELTRRINAEREFMQAVGEARRRLSRRKQNVLVPCTASFPNMRALERSVKVSQNGSTRVEGSRIRSKGFSLTITDG